MPGVKHAATSSQARRVSIHRDRLPRNVASAIADEEDNERRDILGGDAAPQRYALQRAGVKILVRYVEGFGLLAHHAFDPWAFDHSRLDGVDADSRRAQARSTASL